MNIKIFIIEWGLQGLAIGLAIGFIFEVHNIRNSDDKFEVLVVVPSIISMGLMGWISWIIANYVFPGVHWKISICTLGATVNTWWIARFSVSGKVFKAMVIMLLPEKLQKAMEKLDEK